ncbi:MAG: YggS family pyridoxal phosphate-dependent enzyme [Cycloclasticus sp.]|nr:MAG: YggS family pyridoxal phosphate-dependent enzyme [Cycloclasticus sp.]
MPLLLQRYFAQRQVIDALQRKHGLAVTAVKLLAVSKTKPAEDILALYKAGQRDFGENYLQEALQKIRQLAHLDIAWHFIGPIQSNKTRDISRYFDWVHSVDRMKIARRLDEQRSSQQPALNICLQVNIDDEPSKSGFKFDELALIIEPILTLQNIRLRGLMTIPKAGKSDVEQRISFKKLAKAKEQLNEQFGLQLDTLSMGMSGDIEAALIEGSTMVRIGTAIFGAR